MRKPHPGPLSHLDFIAFLAVNIVVIGGMWLRHGGLGQIADPGGQFIAAGQLAALYGTFAVLVQIALISRAPWLERRYGMDELNYLHRWTGFFAVTLLVAHAGLTTWGYADSNGVDIIGQTWDFIAHWPDVLAAIVGLVLFLAVAVTSMKAARRALDYETWWFIHLYAYLAVIISFAHQIAVGPDFTSDRLARIYWAALYGLTAVLVLGFRWLTPLVNAFRYRLRVAEVVHHSPDVVSVVLRGHRLDRMKVESGQFFLLRFLTRDRWWKAHPISVSAAPDGRSLRFTIKALGDDTTALQFVRPGTRVMAEGPYGTFTAARARSRRLVLIGGGIGITPLRAMYEDLDRRPGDVDLLYRARNRDQAIFADELAQISRQRGFGLHFSFSRPDGRRRRSNPFNPAHLKRLIPDIAQRDVYICGPSALVSAATNGLRKAGVPRHQIHAERFGY